ncbi:MAG: hypothetical protein ACJ790_10305 [Myxococcaceae bacterium]
MNSSSRLVLFVGFLVGAALSGVACKSGDPCDDIVCGAGLTCDAATKSCKPSGVTTGCPTACSGTTPICDTASNSCKACTANQGCSAVLPYCDQSVASGRCVQCLDSTQCTGQNHTCDPTSHTCVSGAGGGTGGGVGGGAGGGGGTVEPPDAGPCGRVCNKPNPVCDETAGQCVACLQDTDCPGWNKKCVNNACELQAFPFRPDGGLCVNNTYTGGSCSPGCAEGFVCVGGACELRGAQGGVQITLKFDQPEDLDLHVDEPLPGGGTCEIWYGDPSENPDAGGVNPSMCGAMGWLDLDSNAGCSVDNVDIENIIYPGGQQPPSGQYNVRVDYFENCSATTEVPYEVTVRVGNQTKVYCDIFNPNEDDSGGAGDGKPITSFTVP